MSDLKPGAPSGAARDHFVENWCALETGTPIDQVALSTPIGFDNVHKSDVFNGVELARSKPVIGVRSPGLDEVVIAAWHDRGSWSNRFIGNRKIRDAAFGRDSVSVLSPGLDYQFDLMSDGGSDFVFFIKPTKFEDVFGDELPSGGAYSLRSAVDARNTVLSNAARAYAAEFARQDRFSLIALETIALQVCLEVMRSYTDFSDRCGEAPEVHEHGVDLRVAKEFILDNLSEPIGLRDIASTLGMSQYHFSRVFKAAEGLTPYQFVRETRIRKAMDLLQRTDQSLADIAYDCGFSSQSHLTTVFKARFGVPPGQWRRLRTTRH